jgi:hypothetical protein
MTPELQKYYEYRFEMMSAQGWKDLVDDLEKLKTQYENIRNCDSSNLDFRKGQVDILDYIIGLKELSERAFEELNEENI